MKENGYVMRQVLTGHWATGPIFDKELRVASRRKRSYLLRSLYLVVLMILMAIVWGAVTATFNNYNASIYAVSRMAEASKIIVTSIAWFQFVAAQLIAVVICSTAINSEIHNRTLYVLMTTPISSFQIVVGKLANRLWQVFLLLAVSLPLMAMVRVLGGISWSYLIETFYVTLSVVFFISTVTIFFSILFRSAYVVIIFTIIVLAILFALIPFMVTIFMTSKSYVGVEWVEEVLLCMNPYFLMVIQTDDLFYSFGETSFIDSVILCALLAASGLLVLWAACRRVRKTALKHMTPKSGRKKYKMPPRQAKTYWLRRPIFLHSLIQRTLGLG